MFGGVFDSGAIDKSIAEKMKQSEAPGFWDDHEAAEKVMAQVRKLKNRVEPWRELIKDMDDLDAMYELAAESGGQDEEAEVRSMYEAAKEKFEKLNILNLLSGEVDQNDAFLTVHAGAGGTEACDWAFMLSRMYLRWAERHGYKTEVMDELEAEGGIKSITIQISGDFVYGYLKGEGGIHRLVRISPFDAAGRRHTSFASCEVIPELDQKTEADIKIDMSDVRIDLFRATGKGGQHINKTDTAVRMTHNPTGIVVSCQAERSQIQNKETCLRMLKAKLFALARASEMERIEDLKGNQMEIAWGSQIRSYVFCPYTLVKDNRTGYEEVDVDSVMDGNIDGFINAFLSGMKNEK